MASSGNADLVGRVLDGRYRLLNAIGRGGSGQVYAAQDTQLQRAVAVKVLHAGLANDAGFLRRFQIEAQVAASMSHPNIMTVHDSGSDDGLPYMVMELLDGGSVRGMLDADQMLTPSQAAHLGRDLARALAYAHKRGIIHRDIKPANLLFDSFGVVKIADFGVARAMAEASWTEPMGSMIGTARYASPEQALGVQLDGRSDMYSLALVLAEAVTGRLPFDAETPLSMLNARTHESFVVDPSLGHLRAVLERCGQLQREDRYPDAQTLVSALDDAVAALPPATALRLAGTYGDGANDPTSVQRDPITALPVDRTSSPAAVQTSNTPANAGFSGARPKWTAAHDVTEVVPSISALPSVVALDSLAGAITSGALPSTITHAGTQPMTPFDQDTMVDTGDHLAVSAAEPTPEPKLSDGSHQKAHHEAGRHRTSFSQRLVPFVVLVMVIAALAGSVAAVAGIGGSPGRAVPMVIGLNRADASTRLAAAQFRVGYGTEVSEDPAGTVIRQTPNGGSFVRSGDLVAIVVSNGPGNVVVPTLLRLSEDKARAAVAAVGLQIKVRHEFDDAHPETIQTVFKSPSDGTSVAPDTLVTVVISDGHRDVKVPVVRNRTYEHAATRLVQLGFKVTRAPQDVFDETIVTGNVVQSDLVAGKTAKFGTTIVLTVSKGQDRVVMPTVVGTQIATATGLILNNRLLLTVVGTPVTGIVIFADQAPGTKLKPGTTITLTVS